MNDHFLLDSSRQRITVHAHGRDLPIGLLQTVLPMLAQRGTVQLFLYDAKPGTLTAKYNAEAVTKVGQWHAGYFPLPPSLMQVKPILPAHKMRPWITNRCNLGVFAITALPAIFAQPYETLEDFEQTLKSRALIFVEIDDGVAMTVHTQTEAAHEAMLTTLTTWIDYQKNPTGKAQPTDKTPQILQPADQLDKFADEALITPEPRPEDSPSLPFVGSDAELPLATDVASPLAADAALPDVDAMLPPDTTGSTDASLPLVGTDSSDTLPIADIGPPEPSPELRATRVNTGDDTVIFRPVITADTPVDEPEETLRDDAASVVFEPEPLSEDAGDPQNQTSHYTVTRTGIAGANTPPEANKSFWANIQSSIDAIDAQGDPPEPPAPRRGFGELLRGLIFEEVEPDTQEEPEKPPDTTTPGVPETMRPHVGKNTGYESSVSVGENRDEINAHGDRARRMRRNAEIEKQIMETSAKASEDTVQALIRQIEESKIQTPSAAADPPANKQWVEVNPNDDIETILSRIAEARKRS